MALLTSHVPALVGRLLCRITFQNRRSARLRRIVSLILLPVILVTNLPVIYGMSSIVPATANAARRHAPGPLFFKPAVTPAAVLTETAVIRRVLNLNSGEVQGSVQQLEGISLSIDGSSVITQDLLVPGTPSVQINGHPTFAGTVPGSGSTEPSNYTVSISGNATLRNLLTRTDPFELLAVPAPPAPSGTRDLSLNQAAQSEGDFATLRDLSLSGQAGVRTIPPGAYGKFTADAQTGFILGVAGSTTPAVYNLQELTLSGSASVRLAGPVILNVANSVTLSGLSLMGEGTNLGWLLLRVAVQTPSTNPTPGLKITGHSTVHGLVVAPSTLVKIDGGSTLEGALYCDRLTLNGLLKLRSGNQPPALNAGTDQNVGFAGTVNLDGSAQDDGLPNLALSTSWSKVSGPGDVTFSDAASLTSTATVSASGTYVLRLTADDSQLTASDEMTVVVEPQNQAPAAHAGHDATITLPDAASLEGSATDDGLPAGSSLSYQWTKASGPGDVTFADATQAVTTASFSVSGLYSLRLTATDGDLSDDDEVQITVRPANQPPSVNAGVDRTISLPATTTLNGIATDDGMPTGSTLTTTWSKVSGPGDVTFTNANALTTVASFSAGGTYALKLSASDSELTTQDEVIVTVIPQNRAPVVSAGGFQTVSLPNSLSLNGDVTDDGLPLGSSVTVQWSTVLGPGAVTFSPETGANCTATLSTPGVYVLRLTATDSVLTGSDDIQVTVIQGNLPPTVNAGADQTITVYQNLIKNPGNEAPLVNGEIPNWVEVAGASWTQNAGGVNNFPTAQEGNFYFYAGQLLTAELRQDIDLSMFAASITNGNQQFEFKGYVRSFSQSPADTARIRVEYRDATNATVLDLFDTGPVASLTAWQLVSNVRTVPAGTRRVRIRLTATRAGGLSNDGYFDNLSLRALPVNGGAPPINVNLVGSVADDGLPSGTLTSVWTSVSGPGTVTFANAAQTATTASFTAYGLYVLRLTANDSQLSGSDDVAVFIANNSPPEITSSPVTEFTLGPQAGEGSLVDLTPWTAVNYPLGDQPAANWIVNPSSFSADQEVNADPSILLSDISLSRDRMEGSWQVDTLDDDDFMGFVFGYQDSQHFYLFDWKTEDQDYKYGFASRGMSVKVVNAATPLNGFDLWPTAGNGSRARTLYHNSIPWDRFTPYKFTLEFHPGLFTITVRQGTTVLDSFTIADSTYTSGKFGFYNFSQANVRYSGFRRTILTQGLYTYDVDAIDPDNDPIIYSLTTFPGLMTIDPATGKITWPVSLQDFGSHGVTVQATDAVGASDTQSYNISVASQNSAPAVEAGSNLVISLNRSAQLRGVVTDDGLPLAGNLTASWSKVSGPGTVTFADSSSPATTATFSEVGTYALRLSATDSEVSDSDEVTVTVNLANNAPVVNAGANQTIGLPQTSVTLNGSATDDGLPENSTLTVTWSKVSGPGTVTFSTPNSVSTTATFSNLGTYVLRLSASDTEVTTTDDVQIVVDPQNQPPLVSAGADVTINVPNPASLQGAVSDDGLPSNGALASLWSKVSGPGNVTFADATQPVTTAGFSATGVYVLRLTAGDGGLTTSDDVQITFIDPTIPPPTLSFNNALDGSQITSPTPITGSVSGGSWIVEYSLGGDDTLPQQWVTFAAGTGAVTNGTLATLDPTMLLNGIYAIRLSATNAGGQTTTATSSVIVNGSMKIGNFTLAFSDLSVPVAGLPIQIIRTYDSRDKRKGDFGVGWQLGIQNVRLEKSAPIGRFWHQVQTPGIIPKYCIEETRKHLVTITFGDGRVYKFQAALNPACRNVAPIDFTDVVYQPVAGLTGTSGATLVALGNNNTIVDGPSEGSVNLTTVSGLYNPRVFRLTTAEGMSLVIEQGVGVKSMTDLNGNTLTINSNGIIHSSGKSVVFTRDSLGRITQITDPASQPMTYTYDANGDLTSFSDRETNTSTFTYNASHGLLTIRDPRGIQPIRNDYDNEGRLISHTDAFGKTIQYSHLISARQERITDRLNNATLYEYDNNGNVIRMTDALSNITTYTYDARDNKASETNALGKTTSYTYDASDNLLTETDPLNNVTRYTYNLRRQALTVTDPKNGVTTNTYDAFGNVTSSRDALGNTTTYTYNGQGMMLTMTDALTRVTRYEHNLLGYLTKETDARNHETTFTYDSNGNRLTQTTTRTLTGGTTETLTTAFEYDKLNRVTKTTHPDLTTTRVVYNSIGQQSAMFDQLGRETTSEYDSMGRVTKTTYPDTKFEESTYDAEGRRLTSKDRAGRLTTFAYDSLGRLTSTTFADNSSVSTVYDAIGRVESTRDARGKVTRYEYDPNCGCGGRRTKVIDALGNETLFTYDANGNQATMKDARSNQTSFEYDALNRRTKTIYADSTFDETVYDALGRNTSRRDQAGKVTQYGYDELGRLLTVTDALNQVTSYTYDELGNQLTQTDALNRTTRYAYDKLGRRTNRTLPLGQVESYGYNAVGNLITRTDFNGKATTYGYDTMNRMLSKTPHSSFGQAPVTFTYTASGRRATMTDASGATVYGYDVRDRMIGKQTPQGTLTYSYDGAGNLLTMRSLNQNGSSVDYGYDTLNKLATVTDNGKGTRPGSGTTTYSYDAVGNLAGYACPNGVETSYEYNTLNRLTSMGVKKGAATLASYGYTLGAAGNRLSVTEANGRRVNYTLDDLYRLKSETIADDPVTANNGVIGYDYDAVGNRLTRSSSIGAVPSATSAYDANDRLASDTYDANGSTTGSGGNVYRYDFENKIVALNPGTANQVTFVYDGDGNRVAKTVGTGASGITTKFLVDTNNPTGYAQVVEEIIGSNVQRAFVHGHSLISQTLLISGNWVTSFYGFDGHGSVRFLTDSSGASTDRYTFDAFGNLIASTGTTPNNYLYAGEQLDPHLGFYYLRARYMNPTSGHFWTMDSFEGWLFDPFSLHKYLYANADGVNHTDPTGQFVGIAETSTASAVRGTVIRISVPIWKRVVAAVLIGVLISGAIVGTGTKFEPDRRLNSMRVQLQEGIHVHIHSKDGHNTDPPGVTVDQMERKLKELFFEGRALIPGRLESDFLGAIIRTGIYMRKRRTGGGILASETGHIHSEPFNDRSKEYRVDLENSFGHNLRQ